MESKKSVKVVMFPWLAMGNLTPFLELAKRLAKKGAKIYFITTSRNIARLPKMGRTKNVKMVSISLPHLDGVPDEAESSMDVASLLQPLLKSRFDLLETPIRDVLEQLRPDWILYDFTSYWIPPLAAQIGASSAYIALFNAATLAFMGPPSALLGNARSSMHDYTIVPDWIPFHSDIAYRPHELLAFKHSVDASISSTPDTFRFGNSIASCDVVAVRSSPLFEPAWISLLHKLYAKPVLPIGSLFPCCYTEDEDDDDVDENWNFLKQWLDQQKPDSVLYAAFGSEASLRHEQVQELSLGLEDCGMPFILVLRDPPRSNSNVLDLDMLPDGFENRVAGRGLVQRCWVPQMKVLSHEATRGFLTHCGWNSVIEGLGRGRVLVLLPLMNDQGLVARMLVAQGLGVEIERDHKDGTFTKETVAKAVLIAMVEAEGETVRNRCREMPSILADHILNDQYIDAFLNYLQENNISSCSSDE